MPRALKPFPIDPEVLAGIRAMEPRDLIDVVRLHRAAMGNSLWAQLGDRFLRTLYSGFLRHPDFRGFVYEDGGRVRGFIAGSNHTRRMSRAVFLRRGPALALAALPGVLRRPSLAVQLLQSGTYFSRTRVGEDITAESMFCSFEPELRGRRISGLINKVLFDEMAAMGHRYLKITTEIDNLGAVRQLSSWGFERLDEFDFYGKRMVVWRLDLHESDRVEQIHRSHGGR